MSSSPPLRRTRSSSAAAYLRQQQRYTGLPPGQQPPQAVQIPLRPQAQAPSSGPPQQAATPGAPTTQPQSGTQPPQAQPQPPAASLWGQQRPDAATSASQTRAAAAAPRPAPGVNAATPRAANAAAAAPRPVVPFRPSEVSQAQPAPAPAMPQPQPQPPPVASGQPAPPNRGAQAAAAQPPTATQQPQPTTQQQANASAKEQMQPPVGHDLAATDLTSTRQQAGAEASQARQQVPGSKVDAASQQAEDAAAAASLEGSLSATPGYAQAVPALKALDQEGKSRLADLQARYPEGPPPEAVQAIHADLAQRSTTILAQSQEKLAAAQSAYAGLKAAMNTQTESEVRPTIAKNLAEALHIPTEEADGLIEDMRNLDWNEHIAQDRKIKTPEDYAREHEKIQESKSISGFIHALGAGAKDLWNGTSDKRQTRLLTNGAIIVNPAITGEQEYQDAIAATTATPEAKAAALGRYPEVRQAAGQNVLDNIQEIADTFGKEYIQDWQDFASQRPQDVSEQEWAMRFAEKLKTDAAASPFVTRLKEASRSLAQGTNDVGQQAAGLVGGLTGSESAMDLAAKLARRSHAYETTKHLDATESHGMLSRAVFSQLPRLVPSLLPASRAAKLFQGGARMFAATKIGQRLLPALGATIQGAATPAQAVKAIETLTRAGLAGSAAVGGAQTYGSQITDIYDTLRREHPELSHEQALHAAQTPAIISGLATAALTTLGGSQGIQRLLTRPAEAKAAITQVFTSRMQQLGHLGGEFAKGALKENIEETADGLISAIAKAVGTGQSVQQAVGDYIQQIPENALVTSMVGGGGEAISAAGDSTVRRPVAPNAPTPPNLPSAPQQHSPGASVDLPASQHAIPYTTTIIAGAQPSSGSGQQPSTTVNNRQPSQTPPSTPVPTFAETSTAIQAIDKLKAQKNPLSPEQQQALDTAEKTVARRTEDNILKQQAAIEKRGGKLHPTTAKALAAAQAKLAPDGPAASTAQSSSGPAATTKPGSSTHSTNGTTPSQVGHGKLLPDSTTSPDHIDLARRRAENLEKIAAKRKLNPHEQSVYDNARRIRDRNAPSQPEAGSSPQDAAPEGSQAPHTAETPPSEVSDNAKRPPGEAHPEATTAAAPTQAPPTAPETPRSHVESSQNPHPADTRPENTPPSDVPSSPESRQRSPITPSARPSTPPLSVPQSQRLLDNVSRLPAEAQQHPRVQADVAQAQEVVAADAAGNSVQNASTGGNIQSAWKPSSLPEGSADRVAADKWHKRLNSLRNMTNPVSAEQVISWHPEHPVTPDMKQKIFTAAQTFLDMLPHDLVKDLGPMKLSTKLSLDENAAGQYSYMNDTLTLSHTHIKAYTPQELRSLLWHEMAHWLYFSAHLNPQASTALKEWRTKIDTHWANRTMGEPTFKHPNGWSYIRDGLISDYAGRLYPGHAAGVEIPSVYLEMAALGPDKIAEMCRIFSSEEETFLIVMSIFKTSKQ